MKFFVSCPLGYEKYLADEVEGFWFELMDLDGTPTSQPFPELKFEKGGIFFETELHLGLQISFFTKMALRVLLRIGSFEARYYDQLEKSLKTSELKSWLAPQKIRVEVDYVKSRLNNEKNILQAATQSLKAQGFTIDQEALQTLFIRIDHDRVTLSLDISGEHLHKRGYGLLKGEAPIRETLAALLVRELLRHEESVENVHILDPFVGSGTLLAEWVSRDCPLFDREFAGLHLLKTPKIFQSPTWKKNYRWIKPQAQRQGSMMGVDLNAPVLEAAQKNFSKLKEIFHLSELKLNLLHKNSSDLTENELLEWVHKNQAQPETHEQVEKSSAKIWVLTNPPYGERLSDQSVLHVLEKLDQISLVQGLVMLEPLHWKPTFKRLKKVSSLPFSNQGLKLNLNVYKA